MLQGAEVPRVNLQQLLKAMIEKGASDMHITTGAPPLLRIDGSVLPLKLPPLGPVETKQLCYSVLTEEQKIAFEKNNELDFSFGVKNLSRFRANIFMQRGAVAGAFRADPLQDADASTSSGCRRSSPRSPTSRAASCWSPGPTGSGKSTTLASIIDKINSETAPAHHDRSRTRSSTCTRTRCASSTSARSGADTASFKDALKYILRQDPDVVLVGEMRDLETIEAALTIAETGHLVFGTLHTNSCVQTINRIVDVFPPHQQQQIRAQLSFVLAGVGLRRSCFRAPMGPGASLALEIMVPNAAIRNLIREDKVHQIYSAMQVGQEKHGMQTLNQAPLRALPAPHDHARRGHAATPTSRTSFATCSRERR